MIQARELFEVHLTVRNLDRAIEFYRDIVGLALARHLLEYIAMLPHEPRPDSGVMRWQEWEQIRT